MDNTINGRTPEEIKKGLEVCGKQAECNLCGYYHSHPVDENCVELLLADNLALIQQLEAERDQYKRERDAAVKGLRGICSECAHKGNVEFCLDCIYFYDMMEGYGKKYNWQWHGIQEVK